MELIILLIILISKAIQKLFRLLCALFNKKSKRASDTYTSSVRRTPPPIPNRIKRDSVISNHSYPDSENHANKAYTTTLIKELDKTTLNISFSPSRMVSESKRTSSCKINSKRERRREIKHKRNQQHRFQWAVMRTFIIYDTILNSGNIYEIKNAWKSQALVQDIISDTSEYRIRQKDIKIAIRFMKIKIANGECKGDTSQLTLKNFFQLQQKDLTPILVNAYNNLEIDWDGYYNRIKIDKKRLERLEYYIETLSNDLKDNNIMKFPEVMCHVNCLRRKYIKIFESMQVPRTQD